MRKYIAIWSNAWGEYLTFRLNLFLETLGGVAFLTFIILFWRAVYAARGGNIGGYTESEMVTYLLISSVLFIFLWWTAQGDEIADEIHSGRLSHLIIRPLRIPWYYFIRDLPRKVHTFLLGIGFVSLMIIFFRNHLIIPTDAGAWIRFTLAVIIATLLHFLLFFFIALLAFWFEEVWGFNFSFRVIIEVLGGAMIPISLFPAIIREIFTWLPFPYLCWVPSGMLLGKFSASEVLRLLIMGGVWILLLTLLTQTLWRRGIRRYTGVGI